LKTLNTNPDKNMKGLSANAKRPFIKAFAD